MPNMTLAIPDDLKEKMDRFKEINWSEVARQAIREKTLLLERVNQILSGSTLDEAFLETHAAKIKKSVSKKHKTG
ncbi:MAG TPA: hypothetical protein VI749_09255 [Candidatus Omnitrophota bacterium]|nr:hypothetical protein [Candidatus Omnitrophota bacterium]